MTDAVRVDGLTAFSRKLRKLDPEVAKSLRLALNDATDVIVEHAVPRIPKRTGRAARTVKSMSTRTQARVSGGSARAPYYPWLDFGGRVGRKKATKRAFLKKGRYLFAAYHENEDEFVAILADRLEQAARRAGLAVT